MQKQLKSFIISFDEFTKETEAIEWNFLDLGIVSASHLVFQEVASDGMCQNFLKMLDMVFEYELCN